MSPISSLKEVVDIVPKYLRIVLLFPVVVSSSAAALGVISLFVVFFDTGINILNHIGIVDIVFIGYAITIYIVAPFLALFAAAMLAFAYTYSLRDIQNGKIDKLKDGGVFEKIANMLRIRFSILLFIIILYVILVLMAAYSASVFLDERRYMLIRNADAFFVPSGDSEINAQYEDKISEITDKVVLSDGQISEGRIVEGIIYLNAGDVVVIWVVNGSIVPKEWGSGFFIIDKNRVAAVSYNGSDSSLFTKLAIGPYR